MNKLFIIIAIWLGFAVQISAQKSYEMEILNLVQVNETEFTFDIRMRNTNLAEPFAIETIQFQLSFNDFRNGGLLVYDELAPVDYLTYVANTTDLVGTAIIPTSGNFTTNSANTVMQWVTDVLGTGAQTTMFNTTDWKRIGTFKVQLRNTGNTAFHNFADIEHNIQFNANLVEVLWCNTTTSGGLYYRSGSFAELITNKTLTNSLADRQLAGYWFEGDGDWDEATFWNNVTLANANTLPGPNSNAIINGNVTIPNTLKSDISLLPDVNGNGGELTVLTGEEPIYTLTLTSTNQAWRVRIREGHSGVTPFILVVNPGNTGTIDLPAGYQMRLYANDEDGIGGTFDNWSDDDGLIGTTVSGQLYTMPAKNISVTANITGVKDYIGVNGGIVQAQLPAIKAKSLFSSLTIVPGASLTVDKLFNDSDNGAAAIVVKSVDNPNGTGYLIHNNSGVLATVERFLKGTKYHYVSSPVADATQSLLHGTLEVDDFYEWVEATRLWINLNHPDNYVPNGILTPAKGYAVAYAAGDLTKDFAGALNTGNIGILSTYTPGSSSPFWNQRGFNLLGNPYPAALVADEFLDANTDVYGLYFWDEAPTYEGNRNDYAVYTYAGGTGTAPGVNGANSNAPTGFIAPMQGFMAQLKHTPFNVDYSTTINFVNDMRSVDDTYFYKETEDRDRIWLSVTGPEDDYNEILVAFMEGAQEELDRTDAEKIKGNEMLSFHSMLEGIGFAIQGLPVLNSDTYEISLGLTAGISGQYTFNVEKIENFDPDTDITFEDRLTGEIINLKTTPQYVVSIDVPGNPIDINDRFYLHLNGPTSVQVVDQKVTRVFAVNNQIFVLNSGNSDILDVEVINTLGQLVVSTPVNSNEATINVPGRNVVYIVRVRTGEGVESHKLLIR